MPRLAPSLFWRAGRVSPYLATLLPVCRTIGSARNELRWIRTHIESRSSRHPQGFGRNEESRLARWKPCRKKSALARLVARRGAGEPLQYVLGSQPFGELDILCRKGVLIPRPETEAWVSFLGEMICSPPSPPRATDRSQVEDKARNELGGDLRIVDFCSGTGCISLSLYASSLALTRASEGVAKGRTGRGIPSPQPGPRVFGFDIESRAVRLARKNVLHNQRVLASHFPSTGHDLNATIEEIKRAVTFHPADIFTDEWMGILDADSDKRSGHHASILSRDPKDIPKIDILVSNPPYISQRGFEVDTGRNVRNHEPKLALVPLTSSTFPSESLSAEDIFYARLLTIASLLRPRVVAFEVGDMAQAKRVVEMALGPNPSTAAPSSSEHDEVYQSERYTVPRWDVAEIWRDWPDSRPAADEEDTCLVHGRQIPVRGSGHGRVVFLAEGRALMKVNRNKGLRHPLYA